MINDKTLADFMDRNENAWKVSLKLKNLKF